jgi:hypothetical protein
MRALYYAAEILSFAPPYYLDVSYYDMVSHIYRNTIFFTQEHGTRHQPPPRLASAQELLSC